MDQTINTLLFVALLNKQKLSKKIIFNYQGFNRSDSIFS